MTIIKLTNTLQLNTTTVLTTMFLITILVSYLPKHLCVVLNKYCEFRVILLKSEVYRFIF